MRELRQQKKLVYMCNMVTISIDFTTHMQPLICLHAPAIEYRGVIEKARNRGCQKNTWYGDVIGAMTSWFRSALQLWYFVCVAAAHWQFLHAALASATVSSSAMVTWAKPMRFWTTPLLFSADVALFVLLVAF